MDSPSEKSPDDQVKIEGDVADKEEKDKAGSMRDYVVSGTLGQAACEC